jgi:hypothetical protein
MFRRFQAKMLAAMAPQNELQRWIAMRVVRLARRIERLETYEAAVIEEAQEGAELETADDIARPGVEPLQLPGVGAIPAPDMLELGAKTTRSNLEFLMRLHKLPADATIRSNKALDLLEFVADYAKVTLESVVDLSAEGGFEGLRTHAFVRRWTVLEISDAIAAIARQAGVEPDSLRLRAIVRLVRMSDSPAVKLGRAVRDFHRRRRLLPDTEELERIARYEAHLSRRFVSCLHEYEALQARDRGERAPLARLDVAGLR